MKIDCTTQHFSYSAHSFVEKYIYPNQLTRTVGCLLEATATRTTGEKRKKGLRTMKERGRDHLIFHSRARVTRCERTSTLSRSLSHSVFQDVVVHIYTRTNTSNPSLSLSLCLSVSLSLCLSVVSRAIYINETPLSNGFFFLFSFFSAEAYYSSPREALELA